MVSGWLLIMLIKPCKHEMVPSDEVRSFDAIQKLTNHADQAIHQCHGLEFDIETMDTRPHCQDR